MRKDKVILVYFTVALAAVLANSLVSHTHDPSLKGHFAFLVP